MDSSSIKVSVICMAFNHEKYIRKTLEGFVSQKTDFLFEVIVHDDASTDRTADIIREYERRYPTIIKPIYQEQNQHTLRTDVRAKFLLPRIQGSYVALCEGDDFWCDPYKLQRQADALDTNPTCHMCVHSVAETYEDGTPNGNQFPSKQITEGVLPSRKFLELGEYYSFHTSSYFFRKEHYTAFVLKRPEFVRLCDVGDETYLLYFGQLGDVYYISNIMSCYRRGVSGSWSVRQRQKRTAQQMLRHPQSMVNTFISYDIYTNGRYHDLCVKRIARQMAIVCILSKSCYNMLKKENREYYASLSKTRRIYILFGTVSPKLCCMLYLRRLDKLAKKRGIS